MSGITLNDLKKQWAEIQNSVEPKLLQFFREGNYVSQDYVANFEQEFAKWTMVPYAIGVANGTAALDLCYKVIDPNERCTLILQSNTFVSDIFVAGRRPVVLVDCDEYYQIDVQKLEKVLCKTDGPMIVCITHMYGHPANLLAVEQLCDRYDATLVEDCSHAHGAIASGHVVGSVGHANAFSLYPGKTLGAAGEAGIITTRNFYADKNLRLLRHLGMKKKYEHEIIGYNHRMDDVQAIILSEKLNLLDRWNARRQKNAYLYNRHLDPKKVDTPKEAPWCDKAVYYTYTIRHCDRDGLKEYLSDNDIPTNIYWPTPIGKMPMYNQLQECENTTKFSSQILGLPCHPYLSDEDIIRICEVINDY